MAAAQIPVNGLVANYRFDGNGNDSGPNSLHATSHGATLTADRFGRSNAAYAFNGTSGYLEVADDSRLSLPTTGELSISVWMRPDVLTFPDQEGSGYVHWMGKGTPGQHEYALRMYGLGNTELRDNRTSFYVFSAAGGLGAGSYVQESVVAGKWIHYVATVSTSGDQIRWYKNGVLKDQDVFLTGTFAVTPANGTAPLRIGTRDFNSYFQGAIDDIAIYNRVLTASEIHQLSTFPEPGTTQLVNDPFIDGNRSNTTGGDAAGAVWFQGQAASLTVVDENSGIGSGNALRFAPGGDAQKFLTFFSAAPLSAAGDTVRASFDYRFSTAPGSVSGGFRFGLYNSNSTRQSTDTTGTTRNDDKGYVVSTNAGASGTSTTVNSEDANATGGSDILGGSPPYGLVALGSSGGSVASGTTAHHAQLQISRLANGDLAVSAQIDGLTVASGTHPMASVLTSSIDELAIGFAGSSNQPVLLLDNVLVEALTFQTVSMTSTNATEGGSGTFNFTRTATGGPLTVTYTLSGTAVPGLDYPAPAGTVTFPDGVATQTVTIAPVADRYLDPGDTVIATIAVGTGYVPSATQASATMTITDATTSPYEVVAKNAVTIATGFGPATRSVQTVTGQSFTQALRIDTPSTASTPYESGTSSAAKFTFDKTVTAGDKLVVSLWARATAGDANGEAYLRLKVLNSSGADSSGEAPRTVGSAWRLIEVPFLAAFGYPAGAGQLSIFAGYGPQTIEIGAVSVVNHGNVSYSALGIPLYEGREANAAWRAAAAVRIEQNRKADFTVQVRDPAGHAVPGATVRVAMKRHAFGFGSIAGADRIVSTDTTDATYGDNQKLRDTFLEMFNWAVLGNDLKWPNWEPTSGTFNTTAALNAARWIRDHGASGLRGHNLVWPSWAKLPAWLQTEYNARVTSDGVTAAKAWLRTRVLAHIAQEAPVVGTLATRWDVLNEPFTNHSLQDLLGTAEIAAWFQQARTFTPAGTPLALNDYDNEGEDLPHINFLISTMQGQPAPLIDAIGLQSHLNVRTLAGPDRILTVMDRYAALGKAIEVTEFDLGTDGDEQLQADYLRDYLTLAFSHPAVRSFLVWSFWEGSGATPDRALYRTDWSIKPNGQAWRNLVLGQWWTDTTVTTDANGNATIRGFHGDYAITATAGVRAITVAATLGAGGATVPLVPRDSTAVVLAPVADAYVQDDLATMNFGTATELLTKQNSTAGSNNRDSYLKFDLTTVPEILSAKLRLRAGLTAVSGSNATLAVSLSACAVADVSWTENGLTWDNRPALGAVRANVNVTGTMPNPATQWVELDVTAYLQSEKVAGRNVVTLALHNSVASNPRITIASRETAAPPELVVTTPKGIALWRAQKFGANAGTAIADDLANPDSDSFLNVQEYALGGEPLENNAAIAPVAGRRFVGPAEYLTLTFNRVIDAIDITYTVEGTSTLENPLSWQPIARGTGCGLPVPVGAAQVSESGSGTVRTVEVRDSVAFAPGVRRFLRLRIERQ